MGHAVYTLSDPRAELCRRYARSLAQDKGMGEVRGTKKPICANIDLYTGFIYQMLGIPQELFTPLFAVARMAGWSAAMAQPVPTKRTIS